MWSGKEEESRMTPAFPAWVTVYIQSIPFTEVRKTRASGLGMIKYVYKLQSNAFITNKRGMRPLNS